MGHARWMAVLAVTVLAALPARAGEVMLRSHDGSIALTGQLKAFDGNGYVIDTGVGQIRLDAHLVRCEGADCPPPEALRQRLRAGGPPGLIRGLLGALVEEFALARDLPVLREPVDRLTTRLSLGRRDALHLELVAAGIGDAAAVEELSRGDAAIALSTRPPAPGASAQVVALDALAVAVAPENPVGIITIADLVGVLSGRITDWAALGGPPGPVRLYLAAPGGGARESLERLLLAPNGVGLSGQVRLLADDAAVADAVAADPQGLGVVGSAFLGNARALALRGECGILWRPDPFAVKAEEYPLTRRIHLLADREALPPDGRRLVDFALSDAAQPVIADAGFVDLSIMRRRLDAEGMRLAQLLLAPETAGPAAERRALAEMLLGAERLSVTFRFAPGSDRLDGRGMADIRRLADLLASPELAGREALLIGFTDSLGQAALNRALSLRLAETVRAALLATAPGQAGQVSLSALGLGELSPLGCEETPEGRRVNRRVEVWLRDPR